MKRVCRRPTIDNKYDEDRISMLPEHILHYILSFLPIKDATKTSALSKTWNSTWKSFPVLDFNQYTFQKSRKDRKNPKKVVQDFFDYVDNTISSRGEAIGNIQKFQVVVNFKNRGTVLAGHKNLGRWINYAINNNVKELILAHHGTSSRTNKNGWRYILSDSIFRSTLLENLDLFGCRFMKLSSWIGIGFSLRKLRLSQVYIDQETLQRMVDSSSSRLEELTIESCQGFEEIKVSGDKLERVDLYLDRDYVQIVAVSAPNLRSLSYGGGIEGVRGSIMASKYYDKNLKELRFHDVDITDAFFREITAFPQLEKLELIRCCFLESIRISDARLLELSICDCVRFKKIELDTSRLSYFNYDGEISW